MQTAIFIEACDATLSLRRVRLAGLLRSVSEVLKAAEMRRVFVVFGADELQDLFLRRQRQARTSFPRARIRVGIFDGVIHLEMAEVRPPDPLDDVQLLGV